MKVTSSNPLKLALVKKAVPLLAIVSLILSTSAARAFDILYYQLYKGQVFTQSGTASPAPAANSPFVFLLTAQPDLPAYVTNPVLHLPSGATHALVFGVVTTGNVPTTNLVYNDSAATQASLDSTYGSGAYVLNYTGQYDGPTNVSVMLGADVFPPAPSVLNLAAAQTIDSTANFTLNFTAWPGAQATDFVQLTIFDASSNIVFTTPAPNQISPSPLNGATTSIVISNNSLGYNQTYSAALTFVHSTTNDVIPFTGVFPVLVAGFSSKTTFTLATQPRQIVVAPVEAPPGLSNSYLTLTITNGNGAFASSGSYQIFTLPAGNSYVVLGNPGAGFSSGAFTYSPSASNTALVSFTDSHAGALSLNLAFTALNRGTFALSGPAGTQAGTVAAGLNYTTINPPNLFLPNFNHQRFQSFLSGDDGINYTIEASTNFTTWSAVSNLAVPNLTTNFSDTNLLARRYYRAKIASIAFAPTNLIGDTLNCAISGGATPFAPHGIFQFTADTNNNGYQILAGTGTTNSSGTYTYALTGSNTAVLTRADSLAGTVVQQLVFTSVGGGFYYATNSGGSGFQSGSFTLNPGPVLFFGNAQFTPDAAHGNSVLFPATGLAASLSVTDAVGYVWTLTIPGDALLAPAAITMTPYANISSATAALPILSGVQLAPEGLQFCDGVTLAFTAPAPLGPHASLLMGAGDGTGLRLVQTTSQSATYSTTLFHFSSGTAADPSDQQWQDYMNANLPQAQAAYSQAQSQVQALMRPVVTPPEPPDYEFNCTGDNPGGDAAVDAYVNNLFTQESTAIQNLLSASRDLVLLTGDESYGSDAIALSRQLIESSCYRKIDSLFSAYSQAPKKFTAVAKAAFSTDRQDELLGGAGRPDWLDELLSWLSTPVLDYYWDKLRTQHDYSMAGVLLQVERQIQLLGGAGDPDFISKVAKAYTFQVTLTVSDISGPDAYVAHTLTIMAHDTLTITGDPNTIFPISGSNDFNYDSGVYGDSQNYILQTPAPFMEQVILPMDFCTNATENILVYQMGKISETWDGPDGPEQLTLLSDDFNSAFESAHDGFDLPNDGNRDCDYYFAVPFQNMQATPVDQTFTGPGEFEADAIVTFTIQIQHTPK